jgi:PASTA domain
MTAFVEECRQEWRRLGVPDLLADDMATELETDLADAEADGVSAAEMLGESDPRRFAATWANERGLVAEPPAPKKTRKGFWIWVTLGIVLGVLLLGILLGIGAVALFATTSVHTSGPAAPRTSGIPPNRAARVPNVVGLRACHAEQIAVGAGVRVRPVPISRCHARVVGQTPGAGQVIRPNGTLTLRLRRG